MGVSSAETFLLSRTVTSPVASARSISRRAVGMGTVFIGPSTPGSSTAPSSGVSIWRMATAAAAVSVIESRWDWTARITASACPASSWASAEHDSGGASTMTKRPASASFEKVSAAASLVGPVARAAAPGPITLRLGWRGAACVASARSTRPDQTSARPGTGSVPNSSGRPTVVLGLAATAVARSPARAIAVARLAATTLAAGPGATPATTMTRCSCASCEATTFLNWANTRPPGL